MTDAVFTKNPRFELSSHLGGGSFGAVYRAFDRELGAEVALKTIGPVSGERLFRIKAEFRAVAGLVHPNLVQLYELFVEEGSAYFTMAFVEGEDFVSALRHSPDASRTRDLVLQLFRGVAALHDAGRAHRDIKPSNVLAGADGRAVLLDFDLVSDERPVEAQSASSEFAGTYAYAAPEQRFGRGDMRSDLYSVGVLLHEALTGTLPPESHDPRRPAAAAVRSNSALGEWADLVGSLLEEPDLRPSAKDVVRQLDTRGFAATSASGDSPFVGRRHEVEELENLLGAEAPTRVVAVSGPSGIGKSELVRHVLDSRPSSTLILYGKCHPQESVTFNALDALVDGITQHLLALSDDERRDVVGDDAAAIAALFPVFLRVPESGTGPSVRPSASVESRRAAVRGLRRLLVRLAQRQPTFLWVDDAQWADADSQSVLSELLRPPQSPRLALIFSHRSTKPLPVLEAVSVHAEEHGALRFAELELGPLEAADARELFARVVAEEGSKGAAGVDTAMDQLGERSPFLITRLAAQAKQLPGSTELDVGAALRAETETLEAPVRELLELISLCGHPTERSTLLLAAGLGEQGRPLLAQLEGRQLIRSQQRDESIVIESYHDRVRESIEHGLSEEARRSGHHRLALGFERSRMEPSILAFHFHGAGEMQRASSAAEDAATRAAAVMGFDQSAKYFRQAREWWPGDDVRESSLLNREAKALTDSGRLADGGARYLESSERSSGLDRLDLRRRGMEALLAAGRFDEGDGELRRLLGELDLPYPATPQRALLGAVGHLVRELIGRRRSPVDVEPIHAVHIDACYSAGRKLVDVDSVRGAYFSALALTWARRLGDDFSYARSLCIGGGAVGALGGPVFERLGGGMMQRAENIARSIGSADLQAMIDVAFSEVLMLSGRWKESYDRGQRGIEALSRSPGFVFECNAGRIFSLRNIEELGDVDHLYEASLKMRDDSAANGNVFSELSARQHLSWALLARDDVEGARDELRDESSRLTRSSYHMQHCYGMRAAALCDLYEGRVEEAGSLVASHQEDLRGSVLMRIPLLRTDVVWLRGRVALALAAKTANGGSRSEAEAAAKSLAREGRADASVRSSLLTAGLRSLESPATAAGLAIEAAERAEAAGMGLVADAARLRSAGWLADAGAAAEAASQLAQRGVVSPARTAATVVPGAA